jgi:hypothetical protein
MRSNSSNNKRSRGRNNNNRRNGNNRSQVFDSNGPDVRIRGTAHQVNEKYMALAKDASSSGDLILAESYLQHAEHYQRIINSWNLEDEEENKAQASKQEVRGNRKSDSEEDELSLPASILTPAPAPAEEELQDA